MTQQLSTHTLDATGLHSQYDRNSEEESLILDRVIQEGIQEETALPQDLTKVSLRPPWCPW